VEGKVLPNEPVIGDLYLAHAQLASLKQTHEATKVDLSQKLAEARAELMRTKNELEILEVKFEEKCDMFSKLEI
jgi:hypothetical protein